MKFFLLGFMGAGKSHWGRIWSHQHELDFFDLDHVIEKEAGKTIAQIFDEMGESIFRELEKHALHQFEGRDHFILSCGGGTPCFFNNMSWMNSNGITIYLKTPIEVLKERLRREQMHRPLISSFNEEQLDLYIRRKLEERENYYNKSAFIVESDLVSPNTFTEIVNRYV
ncbi:MAG: shikimate kinase [Bacteroidetes bacterium]|nr:MAG: shikimate kinase [Bacteroidota bacterium]